MAEVALGERKDLVGVTENTKAIPHCSSPARPRQGGDSGRLVTERDERYLLRSIACGHEKIFSNLAHLGSKGWPTTGSI